MILTDVQQVAQTAILAQSLGALESNTALDADAPFTNEQKTDFVRIVERREKNRHRENGVFSIKNNLATGYTVAS